jgi:cell division protein FtsL
MIWILVIYLIYLSTKSDSSKEKILELENKIEYLKGQVQDEKWQREMAEEELKRFK